MSIKIHIAENSDEKKWDDAVQSSPYSTIFHTFAWLKIAEKHTKMKLYPLMAYDDEELVAVYPFFIKTHAFINLNSVHNRE